MYNPGYEQKDSNVISLNRNENLFINKSFLKKLYIDASNSIDLTTYPESTSYTLRTELAKKHNCSPEEIYIGNGADGVLGDLFLHFRNQYDEIGLQDYTYQVYPYLCNRYKFNKRSYKDTNQLWVIDSPNSINGNTFDFSSISKKPDFLIWDNVYGDFDDTNPLPILDKKNILRINSFSKFYGLASLRVGYCIAHKNLIAELHSKKDIFNVNSAAQQIAILALQNHDYFYSLIPEIIKAREFLTKELRLLGFKVEAGKANFIWISHPRISAKKIELALREKNILVRHFNIPNLDNGLRVGIPPIKYGKILLDQISQIIKEI